VRSARFRTTAAGLTATLLAAVAVAVPATATADSSTVTALSARVGTKMLKQGQAGKAVEALQALLREAGFDIPVNGTYGEETVDAVRRFQHAVGISVTGTANSNTLRRLKAAVAGHASAAQFGGGYDAGGRTQPPKRLGDRLPLRRGMSGRDVRHLQQYLRRAGFKVTVDGYFGNATAQRVRQFERSKAVKEDGVVNAADLALLREDVDGAPVAPDLTVRTAAGSKATLGPDGLAIAPEDAPDVVKKIIAAGNEIAKKPYVYGGGHRKWIDRGYDCSGSVSYALHGAGLLDTAMPSGSFMKWGEPGPGRWVTIYANKGHMYMVVAGLRFDTSGRSKTGSRWQTEMRSPAGFTVVHPPGL